LLTIPETRLLRICEKIEQFLLEVKQLRLMLLEGDFCQSSTNSNSVILLKLHAMVVDPLAAMKHIPMKSPVFRAVNCNPAQRECVDNVMNSDTINSDGAGDTFSTYQVSRTQLQGFYAAHNPRKVWPSLHPSLTTSLSPTHHLTSSPSTILARQRQWIKS
jgi:hypothetical protein